jgi:cytidylate kinase
MKTTRVDTQEATIIAARVASHGIRVTFADGHEALVPFSAIPRIKKRTAIASIELLASGRIVVHGKDGGAPVIVSADFARYYDEAQ